MMPGAPTYRLTCGCTDWCNCVPCTDGTVHEEGTSWNCDRHGATTVAWASARAAVTAGAAVTDGGLIIICGIPYQVFLVRCDHLSVAPAELQAAIRRGLECPTVI